MAFSETDFLKVSFSVREEGGRLAETTDEAEAKKEGIYNEKLRYRPTLVMLKDTRLVKGFKDVLLNASVGKAGSAHIAVQDAFGERKPDLVRVVPLQKFKEGGVDPVAGMVVNLDDYRGRIQSVSGGRVRVDLNHELAGKKLVYHYNVEAQLQKPEEKLQALLLEFLDLEQTLTMKDGEAEVDVSMETARRDGYLSGKYTIVQNALLYIAEISKIVWKETFSR
ncbi:hypothetical protein KJ765_04285 [Candidatus Micrarchaeota archaeon]|nr:hypothetical protein [Candidatus Micrarchaeota archaeon]